MCAPTVGSQYIRKMYFFSKFSRGALFFCYPPVYLRVRSVFDMCQRNTPLRRWVEFGQLWCFCAACGCQCFDVLACTQVQLQCMSHAQNAPGAFSHKGFVFRALPVPTNSKGSASVEGASEEKLAILRVKSTNIHDFGWLAHPRQES